VPKVTSQTVRDEQRTLPFQAFFRCKPLQLLTKIWPSSLIGRWLALV